MPLNSYQIDRPINVIRGQRHVVIAAGRYETSDPEIIRIIHSYPNVRFLGSVPTPAPSKPSAELWGPAPDPVTVTNQAGLQMRLKRPMGGRVADSE
jgi:hypothetical protein